MISLRDFSYRFAGSDRYVLRHVDLEIAPGDFVIVTGPSGSGKSTLALALSGFLFNQYAGEAEGAVTVGGLDVRRAPIYEVAETVGLVQQNPERQFCTLTVQDEVAFGLENRCVPRERILARLAWALDVVGAAHLRDRSLSTLSGGEKQRIAVASMLAARPKVLIFDEPTSNLDPTATAEIFDVIARIRAEDREPTQILANGCAEDGDPGALTVVVIEHKVDYLRRFDPRWLHVAAGEVIEHHTPPVSRWSGREPGSRFPQAGREIVVRVENLSAGYTEDPVLRDVSFTMEAGEFVVVMGDNGSGKSTLLQSLMGFLKPRRGRVEVLGLDTRRTPVSKLARNVGYVFQNPDHQLFADTVWDEAMLALRNFDLLDDGRRARVGDLLERAGLRGRESDPPYRLSYGQKRRLNLISVLGYAPCLLLLDEVLIGQDPASAAFVLDLLREEADRGAAVVMVSHAPEVAARYADRVLFLDHGRLIVDDVPQEGFATLAKLGRTAYLPLAGGISV